MLIEKTILMCDYLSFTIELSELKEWYVSTLGIEEVMEVNFFDTDVSHLMVKEVGENYLVNSPGVVRRKLFLNVFDLTYGRTKK